MESNMVADMEVDIVATVNKEVHHHKFALADYTAMSYIFLTSLRRSLALALALALVFNIILKILKY